MGSGFKDFAVGEVLGSADVDNYLMKQTVMVFAAAAARDAAITSPEEGMVAYLTDVDALTIYAASVWVLAMYVNGDADYTPAWTAVTTNPNLGNGTTVGSYQRIGKRVQVYARLTVGTTTTFGSGSWRLSLPAGPGTPVGTDQRIHAQYYDSSAGIYYPGHCQVSDVGHVNLQNFSVSGSSVQLINVDSADPFTWSSGDQIFIFGTYEAS